MPTRSLRTNTRRHPRRLVVALLAAAAAVGTLLATGGAGSGGAVAAQAPSAAGAVTTGRAPALRVVTFNACGAMPSPCPAGEYEKWADTVATMIRSRGVDIVGFQEVCAAQAYRLRDQLGAGYRLTFSNTQHGGRCDNFLSKRYQARGYGQRAGIAILARTTAPFAERTVQRLPWGRAPEGTRGRQPRSLLCVTATLKGQQVRVCDTHLGPHDPDRTDQARLVAAKAADTNLPLVLTGDLNTSVASPLMRTFLPRYTSADLRLDLRTAGKRPSIDHILVPKGGAVITDARAYPLAHSDHLAVEAVVRPVAPRTRPLP